MLLEVPKNSTWVNAKISGRLSAIAPIHLEDAVDVAPLEIFLRFGQGHDPCGDSVCREVEIFSLNLRALGEHDRFF